MAENTVAPYDFNFDGWRMKDYTSFLTASQTTDFNTQYKLFASVVTSWPFQLDPENVESYGELTMGEYKEFVKLFAEALGAALKNS